MKKFIFLFFVLYAISIQYCSANQPIPINNGRYVMYQHPTFRADQYVLDTQTGKIWQLVKTSEGSNVWEEMFYDCYNNDKTYSGRYINPR